MHDLAPNGSVVIGRGTDAHVRVEHSSVSRKHAILHVGAGVRIEDLGSSNGTFVHGRRLPSKGTAALRPGALLEIGAVLLVVKGAEEPASMVAKPGVVVGDPEMARVHELVGLVAKSALSVVLLGETGVGKEVIAERIHEQSPRAGRPFVKHQLRGARRVPPRGGAVRLRARRVHRRAEASAGLSRRPTAGRSSSTSSARCRSTHASEAPSRAESGEVTRWAERSRRASTFASSRRRIGTSRTRSDAGGFAGPYFRLDGVASVIPPLRERPRRSRFSPASSWASAAAGRTLLPLSDDALASLRATRGPATCVSSGTS